MAELKQTVDYERLPEFRQLVVGLSEVATEPYDKLLSEVIASFVWNRLWVDLAYQAESTCRPGWLGVEAAQLYIGSLAAGVGVAPVMGLLVDKSRLLRAVEGGGWQCDRFARLNPHLSGDFKRDCIRGNLISLHERRKRPVAHEVAGQVMLLPREIYKRADGRPLVGSEINRTLTIIKTMDNCLGLPDRTARGFTEGLIADAAAALDTHSPEEMEAIYRWIINSREHPALPRTTEQTLAELPRVVGMMAR